MSMKVSSTDTLLCTVVKKIRFVMDIIVPKAYTPSSLLSTIHSRVSPNKGVGRDRMNARILRDADCGGDENNDEKSSVH